MTTAQRKKILINAIREIEDTLCILRHCGDTQDMSKVEIDEQIESHQRHLRCAITSLIDLVEKEIS